MRLRLSMGTDSHGAVLSRAGMFTGTRIGSSLAAGWRESLAVPVSVFFATRAFLALVVWLSPRLLMSPHIRANVSVLPASELLYRAGSWTRPWFRFDTSWFVGVAEHGYHWGTPVSANTNFLPLYPLLIRGGAIVFGAGPWVASWLVSNLAFLAALVMLWHWCRLRFTDSVAQRTLLVLCIFPFSFFYATPYSESLFLALAVAAFLLAEKNYWPAAVVAAGLSTLTRPVGLAVVLGLVALALSRSERRNAVLSLLGALPLILFSSFLALAFHRPFGFLISHSGGWVHPHGGLLTTITSQFHTYLTPFDRVDALVAVLFLASGVAVWKRLGPGYGVYTLAGVLLPLIHGLVGMERYVIVLFPVFAFWASVPWKAVQVTFFIVSLVGLICATTMFATGYTLI